LAQQDPNEKNFKITEEVLNGMNKEVDETGMLSSESIRDLLKNSVIKTDLLRKLIEATADDRNRNTATYSEETF
jgi:hypothetical protein